MKTIYYTIQKYLQQVGDTEQTTGQKIITAYKVETNSLELVKIFSKNIDNYINSQIEIDRVLIEEYKYDCTSYSLIAI